MLIAELERQVGRVEGRPVADDNVDRAVGAVHFDRAVHIEARTPSDHHIFRFILHNTISL